jgi:molybdate transport system substrate-binding protein
LSGQHSLPNNAREAAMGECGKAAAACVLGVLVMAFQGALPQGTASAAELVIISNQGATPGVRELAAAFGQKTGHKVTVIQADGAALERRLAAGGQADLFAVNPGGIEALAKKGLVVPGTATPFVLAGLGLSVRAGVPKPDISTVEAYKAALLAAKSIGYSRGCSGTHAAQGIEKLGLADTLKAKTVYTTEGPVVESLAKGNFDVGIQQTNIMVGAPGTEYVGALPGFLNDPCPSSVALMAASKEPETARELIKFMSSPEAAPLLRKTHVEPVTAKP